MPVICVEHDAWTAMLAQLDVIDLNEDRMWQLNDGFRADCEAAFDAAPHRFEVIIEEAILFRAGQRGVAIEDLDVLTMTALEIGALQTPEA